MKPEKKFKKRSPLVIECTGGAHLGRCYNSVPHKITSTNRLSAETIQCLFRDVFLSYGQEFRIGSQCDGKEEPAGIDKEPSGSYTYEHPYYVYVTETRCDSSD